MSGSQLRDAAASLHRVDFGESRPLGMALGGLLAIWGSLAPWGVCPQFPCDIAPGNVGIFVMHPRSGTDLGPGVATAVLGLVFLGAGLYAWRQPWSLRANRVGFAASVLSLATAAAYVIDAYVLPHYSIAVGEGLFMVSVGGVIGLLATTWLRRHRSRRAKIAGVRS